MSTRDQLAEAVSRAVSAVAGRDAPGLQGDAASVHLERPARREDGDWSTNFALVTAKEASTNPRDLAASLVEVLNADPPDPTASIEIAVPVFINCRPGDGWLYDAL